MTHCVVVVPGIMGSVLELDGRVVWPGKVVDLLGRYEDMDRLLDLELEATDLVRRYFISTQYQTLIDDLERWGFHESSASPTLYLCPYDWRRGNEHSASTLAAVLDRVVVDHPGSAEVTLLGHSMGGLVARHYLESGAFESRPGRARVKLLVTLGTPHRGAPEALPMILGRQRRLWLAAAQVKRLAGDPRYPSAYQLLPGRGEPFAWDDEPGSRYAPLDIYDEQMAGMLGLSLAGLEAAETFRASLKGPAEGVRYFCFGGTRQQTVSLVTIRRLGGRRARLTTVDPEDSGDGTVPDWSATLEGLQGRAVGGEHGTLYKTAELRRNLAILLGVERRIRAAETWPTTELSLRQTVVEPRAQVRGLLSFGATGRLAGEVRLEAAQPCSRRGQVRFAPTLSRHPIVYRGPAAESLAITFPAPRRRGAYRVAFYPAGRKRPAAQDELFVIHDERAPRR